MKQFLFKAEDRGHADHGWLNAYHSFSFANYYDPHKMAFGVLRVLNDDTIAGGRGFGFHPHNNMEIITIPTAGALEHKDNLGNHEVIQAGEVQVMSAGKGIVHSEYNKNTDEAVKLFQIWIETNKPNATPRYDQKKIELPQNQITKVVAPYPSDDTVWIYQDAWIHLAKYDSVQAIDYKLKKQGNGIYVFVIEGSLDINDQFLGKRDALGLLGVSDTLTINTNAGSYFMIIEVPLE